MLSLHRFTVLISSLCVMASCGQSSMAPSSVQGSEDPSVYGNPAGDPEAPKPTKEDVIEIKIKPQAAAQIEEKAEFQHGQVLGGTQTTWILDQVRRNHFVRHRTKKSFSQLMEDPAATLVALQKRIDRTKMTSFDVARHIVAWENVLEFMRRNGGPDLSNSLYELTKRTANMKIDGVVSLKDHYILVVSKVWNDASVTMIDTTEALRNTSRATFLLSVVGTIAAVAAHQAGYVELDPNLFKPAVLSGFGVALGTGMLKFLTQANSFKQRPQERFGIVISKHEFTEELKRVDAQMRHVGFENSTERERLKAAEHWAMRLKMHDRKLGTEVYDYLDKWNARGAFAGQQGELMRVIPLMRQMIKRKEYAVFKPEYLRDTWRGVRFKPAHGKFQKLASEDEVRAKLLKDLKEYWGQFEARTLDVQRVLAPSRRLKL